MFQEPFKIFSALNALSYLKHLLVCISLLNLHIFTHTHAHTNAQSFMRCGVVERVEACVQSIIASQPPYIELKKKIYYGKKYIS